MNSVKTGDVVMFIDPAANAKEAQAYGWRKDIVEALADPHARTTRFKVEQVYREGDAIRELSIMGGLLDRPMDVDVKWLVKVDGVVKPSLVDCKYEDEDYNTLLNPPEGRVMIMEARPGPDGTVSPKWHIAWWDYDASCWDSEADVHYGESVPFYVVVPDPVKVWNGWCQRP